MAGTAKGADRAMQKIYQTYGITKDGRSKFHAAVGAIGGAAGHTGGFTDRELARRAGAIGGSISRRNRPQPRFKSLKVIRASQAQKRQELARTLLKRLRSGEIDYHFYMSETQKLYK